MIVHLDKSDIKSLLGFMGRVQLTGTEAPTFMRIVNALGVAEDEELSTQKSELLVEVPSVKVEPPRQTTTPKKDWREAMSR